MPHNPSNPLLKTAAVAAPVKTSAQPAANPPAEKPPAVASEKETEEEEEDDDEEKDPETPNPAPPESEPAADPNAASSPPQKPKLSVFERGALRALGKGDLIARIERAELEAATLTDQVATLKAENTRLAGELSAFKTETPQKIEAATKGRENEVSKCVAAELTALGITKEAAPAAIGAEATPEGLLEQYALLTGAERTEFLRANKTKLLAAEAAVAKSKK